MTLDELWQLFPIILKPHHEAYQNWYATEAQKLIKLTENTLARINHVGSTAVKGLLSKPTVDILLELKNDSDTLNVRAVLQHAGWSLMSSQTEPFWHEVFNKGYTKYGFSEKVYNLHVRYNGDWNELYFRDYLMEHKAIADAYGQLKLSLLDQYRNDRDGYTAAKTDFVNKYTKIARSCYGNRYLQEP
jgi:GrpB-like predicted nucleotidyltransferase (UPF0157 family)